jgi:hypothetical protein
MAGMAGCTCTAAMQTVDAVQQNAEPSASRPAWATAIFQNVLLLNLTFLTTLFSGSHQPVGKALYTGNHGIFVAI